MTLKVTISPRREADAVFSPDGLHVYVSDGNDISVHDAESGETLATIAIGTALGAIAISPDGRFLVVAAAQTAGRGDAVLYRVDLRTQASERFSLPLTGHSPFFDVAIDAQGTVVASGAQHVYTLDPETGVFTTLSPAFSSTPRLQSSADGKTILIDSDAINDVPLAIYRPGRGIVAQHHDYYDPYAGAGLSYHDTGVAAISADGSKVFDGYRLTIYDARLQPIVHLADRFPYLSALGGAFSPDGLHFYLFGGGASVVVFDTATWDVTGNYAIGVDFVGLNDFWDRDLASRYGTAFEIAADGHTLKVMGTDSVTLVDLNALASLGGTSGDDQLSRDDAATLYGFGGDDVLSSAGGWMFGGEGNDTYEVRGYGADVREVAGQGVDTVHSVVSYVLGDNLENLVLVGPDATYGSGNGLANAITASDAAAQLYGAFGDDVLTGGASDDLLDGGDGADRMTGGAGNDRYVVDSAADIVVEAASGGTDTVVANVSYSLGESVERLELTGNAGINAVGNALSNELVGNDAANTLDGGAGADILRGGRGDDIYLVDQPGDRVEEVLNGGRDTVRASIGFKLGENIEALLLVGSARNGTGNALANTIDGSAADNRLSGAYGDDRLNGGKGNDLLNGGAGGDTLSGSSGDDLLVGGRGADVLNGGSGADVFRFGTGDLGTATGTTDRIVGFSQTDHDRVDLSTFDANGRAEGRGTFTFIGSAAFSGVVGELRYEWSHGATIVTGDRDGDGRGDMTLVIGGRVALTAEDFLLSGDGGLSARVDGHPPHDPGLA